MDPPTLPEAEGPSSPKQPDPAAANAPDTAAPPVITIEVDDDDADSSLGDSDAASYTTSLISEVANYQFENGRRYHGYKVGTYLLPNDEKENDRLDILHHLLGIAQAGKLYNAPIDHPLRILDIGTGSGIWAIEVADEFPGAEVIGVDISPTQPAMVPPNLRFEIDDVEETWSYSSPFDFIHCRYMPACISDFPKLVRQAYGNTKPGGWVEFADGDLHVYSEDGTLTDQHAFKKLHTLFLQACEVMGKVGSPAQYLKQWIEEAGFVNVTHKIIKLPLGIWPKDKKEKEVGAWMRLQFEEGCEAFAMAPLTRALGWSPEEVQVFLVQIRNDVTGKTIHPVYDYHIVCGQKPLE